MNYYLNGHAAKFTLDVTYLPNGVPRDQDGIGVLDPDARRRPVRRPRPVPALAVTEPAAP